MITGTVIKKKQPPQATAFMFCAAGPLFYFLQLFFVYYYGVALFEVAYPVLFELVLIGAGDESFHVVEFFRLLEGTDIIDEVGGVALHEGCVALTFVEHQVVDYLVVSLLDEDAVNGNRHTELGADSLHQRVGAELLHTQADGVGQRVAFGLDEESLDAWFGP